MSDPDETNPFAAPESDIGTGGYDELAEGVGNFKLYSPGQVAWATFLGSPLAGCAVMAANYFRLKKNNSAVTMLFFGLLVSVGLSVIAIVGSANLPGTLVSTTGILVLYSVAKGLQGPTYQRHRAAGGPQASSWGATGIAVACGFVFLIIAFCVAVVMDLVTFV